MGTIELPADRLDQFSDHLNPILVKETRQALKSKQFVGTFMLLLICSWLICTIGIMLFGEQIEFGRPSAVFFQWFFAVLSVAVVVIVPFNAFRSLSSERDSQTYELLSITALSPQQIVWGKLLNAVVQSLVFYCAISPFIAFTSLLQGFDLYRTIVLMTSLLGFSILLSMFTLMLSTVAKNRQYQSLATLLIFGSLMYAISMTLGFSYMVMNEGLSDDFYWALAIGWVMGISYFFLFFQITVSQLLFEAGNKSSGVRLVATLQFLLFWLIVLASYFLNGTINDDLFLGIAFFSLVHWALFGFFISMERDDLSRRVRRDLPKSFFLRLMSVPFMPGGTRGFLLLVLNLLALYGITLAISPLIMHTGSYDDLPVLWAAIAYVLFYYGLGCALGRWLLGMSQDLRPAHVRTILILLFALATIVPYVILFMSGDYNYFRNGYHFLHIANPFATLSEVGSRRHTSGMILPALLFAAGFGILVNIPAMLKAIREIVYPERPADPRIEAQHA